MHEASLNAIDRFAEALWLEDGLAANTLAAYRLDLSLYATWLFLTHRLALEATQEHHLQAYFAEGHIRQPQAHGVQAFFSMGAA
jgi:integrase/recombinase XerD